MLRPLRCASEHLGGRVLKTCALVKIASRATVYHSALSSYKIESRAAVNWVLSTKEVLPGDEGGEMIIVISGDDLCDDSAATVRRAPSCPSNGAFGSPVRSVLERKFTLSKEWCEVLL